MPSKARGCSDSSLKPIKDRLSIRTRGPPAELIVAPPLPTPRYRLDLTSSNSNDDNEFDAARFIAFDEELIRRFRNIPDSEPLLLLTPVVPHTKESTPDLENTDPFEPLGRALSKHHTKIRHVPYHPGKNLTDRHREFLQRSRGVIVVCCEPTTSLKETAQISADSPSLDVQLYRSQVRFTSQVNQVIQSLHKMDMGIRDRELVGMAFGPRGCLFEQDIGLEFLDLFLYAPYHTPMMGPIADLLYGSG